LRHVVETVVCNHIMICRVVKFCFADVVCMLQENLFKQGPAGISPQGDRTNYLSSPVTNAAGMTQVEVQIGIRTDTMTDIRTDTMTDTRTMDTEVAAVSTVTRIKKEMDGATDMLREPRKTAGHIESIEILLI